MTTAVGLTKEQAKTRFKNKLNKMFAIIRKDSKGDIIAHQSFSCCSGCATSELSAMLEKDPLSKDGGPRLGAVYYHRQDAEHLESGRMMIRFCTHRDNRKLPMQLALAILSAASKTGGLLVDWNGSLDTAVCVVDSD